MDERERQKREAAGKSCDPGPCLSNFIRSCLHCSLQWGSSEFSSWPSQNPLVLKKVPCLGFFFFFPVKYLYLNLYSSVMDLLSEIPSRGTLHWLYACAVRRSASPKEPFSSHSLSQGSGNTWQWQPGPGMRRCIWSLSSKSQWHPGPGLGDSELGEETGKYSHKSGKTSPSAGQGLCEHLT